MHLTGALKDLRVDADLRLPDGGRFTTRGTLDLASKEKGYDLVSSLYTVNLRTVNSKAPVTSLTANATVRGRGFQLATMNSTIAADLSTSRLDTIAVDTLSVRASVADGLANVDKLYVLGSHVAANVHGTLGLVKGKDGTIAYAAGVDSLGALNRFIRHTPGDTIAIPPRPGVVARAVRKARADSARIAEKTEIERLATGKPGPKLVVNAPRSRPC